MILIEKKEKELDDLIAEVLEWKKHTNILEMFFGSIRSGGATTYTNELRFQNAVCYLLEKQGMKPDALSDVQEKWAKRFEDMLNSIKAQGKDIQNYIPTFEDIKYMYLSYPFKSYHGDVFDVLKEAYGEPIPIRQKELEKAKAAAEGILFTKAIYAMSREELIFYLVKNNEEKEKVLEDLRKKYENTGFDYKQDRRYISLSEEMVGKTNSLNEMSISKLRNRLFDSFVGKSDTFKYFAYLTKLRLDISCLGKAIGKECLFDDNALIELYKNNELFYEPRFSVDTFCATTVHLLDLEKYEADLTSLGENEEIMALRTATEDKLKRLVSARESLRSLQTIFGNLEDVVNQEKRVLEDYENLPDKYKNSRKFQRKFLREHGVGFSQFCNSAKFNQDKCKAMQEDIAERRGDCRTAAEDFYSNNKIMFEKILRVFPLFTMDYYKSYFGINDGREDRIVYYENAEMLTKPLHYTDIFEVAIDCLEDMVVDDINRLFDCAESIFYAFYPGVDVNDYIIDVEDGNNSVVLNTAEYAPVIFDDIIAIKELADGYFDSEVVKATNSEDLSSAATREKVFRKVDLGGKKIYENN